MPADRLIRVHSRWCGWHSAEIPLEALTNVHWHQPPGAPHEFLHGSVSCRRLINGDIPHDCRGGEAHTLVVCVLKHHATPSSFAELCREADSRREGARCCR